MFEMKKKEAWIKSSNNDRKSEEKKGEKETERKENINR